MDKLLRLEASLRNLAAQRCNDPNADFEDGGKEARRVQKLVAQVTTILDCYVLSWTHNMDPRGSAVYIHFPDGAFNTIGGRETGWGV